MNKSITNTITTPNKDIEILKTNFPNCFDKNGDFDFDKFKKELSIKEIDFSKESYGMDWLGKSYARLLASDPATTLLKEDKEWNEKEENKNSENLLIKGDNLEVLKHLSNAYHEQVKMIYIDPPYNTGSDGFVYQDDRKFTTEEFQELAGVDEEKAKKILSFVNSKSNSHSAWLTFMYSRLYIAKHLLRDDGVIFVSIDDNEVAQLRILMDEIFGEENFVGDFIWEKHRAPKNDNKYITINHEYVLVYSKIKSQVIIKKLERTQGNIDTFLNPDNDLRGVWTSGPLLAPTFSQNTVYSIQKPNGESIFPPEGKCWSFSSERIIELINDNRIWFGKDGKNVPRIKRFLTELSDGIGVTSVFSHDNMAGNQKATNYLTSLFDDKKIFPYPKPVDLIQKFLNISTLTSDIILDFFAGSGTTGDAVMQLNAEDKANGKEGNRKYILVQLPEPIDPKKNKTAYDFVKNELKAEPTIFEITKERLVRAGKKIQAENSAEKYKKGNQLELEEKKEMEEQDFGFKIFETMPIWEDYEFEAKEFDPQAKLFDESKLTSEDLQTLLTTWKTYDNIPLTQNLESFDLDGYNGYYGKGKLYLIDKGFKTKNLQALVNKIDADNSFNPVSIIVFGYHFESKNLREISENVSSYANKKKLDIDFITRY